MTMRNWVLFILTACCVRTCIADCSVIRDEEAIKGTVLNVTTVQAFFDTKYKEYQDVLANHPESKNSDMEVHWESMKTSVYGAKGLILTVSVLNKRKFRIECLNSRGKRSDPITWKGEWEAQKSSSIQLVLYSGNDYPKTKTEVTYFLQPPCCDTFPGGFSCMFNAIPILRPEEIQNICD